MSHMFDIFEYLSTLKYYRLCSTPFLQHAPAINRTQPVVVDAVQNNLRDTLPVNVAAVAILKRF